MNLHPPSIAICHCCHVPTAKTGMCNGCVELHGHKLAKRDDDWQSLCPRQRASSEGYAEFIHNMPPARTKRPEPSEAKTRADDLEASNTWRGANR